MIDPFRMKNTKEILIKIKLTIIGIITLGKENITLINPHRFQKRKDLENKIRVLILKELNTSYYIPVSMTDYFTFQ